LDNKALLRNNPYFAPSDKVREVKEFVKKLPELQKAFGDTIEFRLVVDTNIVLADIRWLAKNRKDGSMRTGLMEIIDAGTAMVYAPRKLVTEVNEHLPGIALEAGISLNLLRKEWLAYKSRLKIRVVDRKLTAAHSNAADPNDAEFIVLADKIQAHGVISKDKHIKDMGGRKLSLEFVFSVRDYSRATAIELNVKYMGVSFGILTLAMAAGLIELIKGAIGGIAKLPDSTYIGSGLLF
jgi:predicted nucleic acid-binding protein